MSRLEDCCYRCEACQLLVCRDEEPSPGEPATCADCWENAL